MDCVEKSYTEALYLDENADETGPPRRSADGGGFFGTQIEEI